VSSIDVNPVVGFEQSVQPEHLLQVQVGVQVGGGANGSHSGVGVAVGVGVGVGGITVPHSCF